MRGGFERAESQYEPGPYIPAGSSYESCYEPDCEPARLIAITKRLRLGHKRGSQGPEEVNIGLDRSE